MSLRLFRYEKRSPIVKLNRKKIQIQRNGKIIKILVLERKADGLIAKLCKRVAHKRSYSQNLHQENLWKLIEA